MTVGDIEEGFPITDDDRFNDDTKKVLPPSVSENDSGSTDTTKDAFHENGESHEGGESRGHAAHPTTYKSLIASSVVCFIIYFVFCIVFSSVVWDPLNS